MKSRLVELDAKQLRSYGRLAVVGDLHGDHSALQATLRHVDPANDGIIFLGDYADRGPCGIEVIDAVKSLLKTHPRNVLALKGNHEDYTKAGNPAFFPCTLVGEAYEKRRNWQDYFHRTFKPFAGGLHLAVIAPGETLFVHGGISTKIRSLDDLRHPTRIVERDVLWSDPFEGQGERANERGKGLIEFGSDVTTEVCRRLGVKRIVRSHEPAKASTDPFYSHGGRVTTVSTTSVYGGEPFILCIDTADFAHTHAIRVMRGSREK